MAHAEDIEALVWDVLDNNSRQYYCIGTLYKILGFMIENSKAKKDDTFDDSLLYVKNVISYIQLKYAESVKIEKIAASLGLNRSYLTRLFKEATGYSPQEYLLTYRMKMAMTGR